MEEHFRNVHGDYKTPSIRAADGASQPPKRNSGQVVSGTIRAGRERNSSVRCRIATPATFADHYRRGSSGCLIIALSGCIVAHLTSQTDLFVRAAFGEGLGARSLEFFPVEGVGEGRAFDGGGPGTD